MEDFHTVDIVIEAIVESEDVKKKLFAQLDNIVKVSAILASNTSSISITRLSSATSRPSQVSHPILDITTVFCISFAIVIDFCNLMVNDTLKH